jgi:antitoxin HicB
MIKTGYPFKVRSLSEEEGGGFLVEYLDLPGCIADGETVDEALQEAKDALRAWILSAKAEQQYIPAPNSHLIVKSNNLG